MWTKTDCKVISVLILLSCICGAIMGYKVGYSVGFKQKEEKHRVMWINRYNLPGEGEK